MQQLRAGVHAGATVIARGETWTVIAARMNDLGALVDLEGCDTDNEGRRATLIAPFDTIVPAPLLRLRRRRRHAVIRLALAAIATARPPDHLWTLVRGRFALLPWQIAPALAVLRGATRLLLADAVGLGKTLQAGLIAAELAARGVVTHTLVLTPPGLRDVWTSELGERLGLDVSILDAATIVAGPLPEAGVSRWTGAPVVVSSIDFVKQPEMRPAIDACPIDLLIVDEAHHLTPGSDRAALVARLARRTPWVVLATATPHDGDARAFAALLDVGGTGMEGEPPMLVFRRTAGDAGLASQRRRSILQVRPTRAERALITGLHDYARDLCAAESGTRPGVRLVAGVLARRATSTAWAAERSLARRLAALTPDQEPIVERQPPLPWEEPVEPEEPELAWLGVPGLPNTGVECARLRDLLALAREARAHASKLQRLERLLRRAGEPAVVFTEFRDSLHACHEALAQTLPVTLLHGGMSPTDRRTALNDFLQGRTAVLLATDVAGEGLNLQSRARLVVTLEWPWSPRRLEQRIGRVDRLGQTRRVHAVHLTSRHTFEDSVVARLLMRTARSSHDLAQLTAGRKEADVEAAVLGSVTSLPHDEITTVETAAGQTAPEIARAAENRRIVASVSRPAELPSWTLPRRRTRAVRVVAVVRVTRVCAGRLEWSRIVPIEVALTVAPRTRRQWRQRCHEIARASAVRRLAEAAAEREAATFQPWRGVSARLRAIRRALNSARPHELQPSLFDRRAVREAEARAAVLQSSDRYLRQRLDLIGGCESRSSTRSRVLLVVPLGPEAS